MQGQLGKWGPGSYFAFESKFSHITNIAIEEEQVER